LDKFLYFSISSFFAVLFLVYRETGCFIL
jgi:hypothetical protein